MRQKKKWLHSAPDNLILRDARLIRRRVQEDDSLWVRDLGRDAWPQAMSCVASVYLVLPVAPVTCYPPVC